MTKSQKAYKATLLIICIFLMLVFFFLFTSHFSFYPLYFIVTFILNFYIYIYILNFPLVFTHCRFTRVMITLSFLGLPMLTIYEYYTNKV